MKLNQLMPWHWSEKSPAASTRRDEEYPLLALQRNMNKMFEEFFTGSDMEPFEPSRFGFSKGAFTPAVNVADHEKEIEVTAELPGMEEKEIQVSVQDDFLTISGEKKEEKEEKKENGYYRMERHYGSFQRVVALPAEVAADKAEAKFKNGVLHITLPKKPEALAKTKKIPVKHED
ncbi:MAG TPA: Hsp20/alpha crystallin family protein [Planctomycetota bacterium]|jgi:HSP20 family protein|nr:Hsp20/alpha crystallin family protein [Planctomycetota bacterium]